MASPTPPLAVADALPPSSDRAAPTAGQDGGSPRRRPDGARRGTADAVAMDPLLRPSIALQPYPPQLHQQPLVLLPLMLLPREHLPLSSIDMAQSERELPSSRSYQSRVKILDLESRLGSVPSVLIARSEPRGALHVVERQEDDRYFVCRLGSWTDVGALADKASALSLERLPRPRPDVPPARDAIPAPAPPHISRQLQKRKRAAMEAIQSLVKKRTRPDLPVRDRKLSACSAPLTPTKPPEENGVQQQPSPVRPESGTQAASGPIHGGPDMDPSPVTDWDRIWSSQQTADTIFDNIRMHYFDALYKSMGSLAYFAKGPLSRARSAFRLDLESNLQLADLIDFLKSLVISTVQIDKKYRETLPQLIASIRSRAESSGEEKTKKPTSKKMKKIGQDALYPFERASIGRWWRSHSSAVSCDPASEMQSRLSLLRTRETQLQMILILEILALEPLREVEDAAESSLPPMPGVTAETGERQPPPPPAPKKRNKHNLPVLVDVHADRLAIWQSTASNEQLALQGCPLSQGSTEDPATSKSSSEPLKDFCVDVIVPFFSSRLPQLCDSISRKLGGPAIVLPREARLRRRSSARKMQKPGAAVKRPAAQMHPRRTLQRALSTEQQHRRSISRGPSNAIALMRSAASTSFSAIKREGSEPATPKATPERETGLSLAPSKRLTFSRSSSSSATHLEDAKESKKAMMEAELQDAISALRKPNRDVVGKAMVEAAECRAMASQSAKRARRTVPISVGAAVQVKATPVNCRFKDALALNPNPGHQNAGPGGTNDDDLVSKLNLDLLASSPRFRVMGRNTAAARRPSAELDLALSVRQVAEVEDVLIPPSSPHAPGDAEPDPRSPPGRSWPTGLSALKESWAVSETPAKKAAAARTIDLGRPSSRKTSVYQQLGWDADLDDVAVMGS